MSPPLFRLGLIVTYRCNAECRHCFFEAGPDRGETMSQHLGKRAIDEAAMLGAEWVSLTGGEPFLEMELLESLVEYASSKELKTEVVSNGYWAETPEIAERILSSLKDLGLDVLNLTIDDFHQEFVAMETVREAYKAAQELGLKVVIMTTTSKDNAITRETIPKLLDDTEIQIIGESRIHDPHALLIETPITPAGRGANISELEYTLIPSVRCREALTDIGIEPTGEVYPCRGPLASKVILGNINEASLSTILDEAWKDPFYSSLREGVKVEGAFTSKCHACLSVG